MGKDRQEGARERKREEEEMVERRNKGKMALSPVLG